MCVGIFGRKCLSSEKWHAACWLYATISLAHFEMKCKILKLMMSQMTVVCVATMQV